MPAGGSQVGVGLICRYSHVGANYAFLWRQYSYCTCTTGTALHGNWQCLTSKSRAGVLGRTGCIKCRLLQSMIPGVCQSVSRFFTWLRRVTTAERIDSWLPKEHFPHGFDAGFAKLLRPFVSLCVETCIINDFSSLQGGTN